MYPHKMHLACFEHLFYWVYWIGIIVYSLWEFAKICQSENHLYRLNAQSLKQGYLTDNSYDASDFEWQSFKKLHINYWYIGFIHVVLSNSLTVYNQPTLKLISWTLVTLYATYTIFSVGALVVVIINVMMLILLAVLGKNILSYALCAGVFLASQSTEIANRIFNPNDPRMTNEFDFEEKRFLFTYCLCFLNARGLSSSLDNLTVRQKKELQSGKNQFYEKVVTITAYLLYLPGFFAGPLYLYTDFEKATRHVKAEPERESFLGRKYFKTMSLLLVLIAEVIYYEWMLHWVYSSAITSDHIIVNGYNSIQFAGFIASLCLMFYLKYCCIYGTFKVFANFDGVASIAPPMPQCVAAVHLNSQLWRTFDVGIYRWLRRYIYDPIVLSTSTIIGKFFATLACFFCIALWHLPLTPALVMWLGLNVIGSFIEIWAKSFAELNAWTRFKSKLSRANYLRTLALIGVPMFLLAVHSNMYFLSGNEHIGNEFIKRVFNCSNCFWFHLLFALYCGANVSIDYNKMGGDLGTMHCSKPEKKETKKGKFKLF